MANVHRPKEYTAKKNHALRLGEPVSHDTTHNCLSCVRWSACKDERKSFGFRCSRYNENSLDGSSIDDPTNFFGLGQAPDPLTLATVTDDSDNDDNIDKMIAMAIAENSPIPPDIKLNDRHILAAPNFYTWLTDERFTGGSMPPFPRQIYVGSLLFGDLCPRCSDMEWFDGMRVDTPLSKIEAKVEFLQFGKCRRCGVDRGTLVDNGEQDHYHELTLICGQRSSKTSTINLMDGYNFHKYLKLSNPTRVFKQQPITVFTSTYTSATFGQVKANMWDPFLNMMNNTPWFTNYHKFLAKRGQELGEELAVVSEIFVKYRHRNLFISPASPSGMTMRGRTRFTAAIDEISHMPLQRATGKEAVRANAKDTYTALRNSLDTLLSAYKDRFKEGYYDLPKPIMYNASSPLTINDYGMTLLRNSKLSDDMLGLKYKTWEFNPNLPRSYFANRFRTNPVEAARDYACEPPIGQLTWMTDIETVAKAFSGKRNMFNVEHYVFKAKSQKKMTSARLKQVMEPELAWGCVLAIDVGSVNNSFAFSVGTVDNDFDLQSYVEQADDEDEDAEILTGLVPVKVIFSGEVIPRRGAEASQHAMYRDIFTALCEALPIRSVISDRWQNKKLVQDMEEEFGCEYTEYSLRWDDFENFKAAMYDNQVILPKLKTPMDQLVATTLDNYPHMFEGKPIEHLAYQFLTVQEARGNTVVKGDATDDMFRTVALIHAACQDRDILELLLEGDDEMAPQVAALGVVVSNTGATPRSSSITPRGQNSPSVVLHRKR